MKRKGAYIPERGDVSLDHFLTRKRGTNNEVVAPP